MPELKAKTAFDVETLLASGARTASDASALVKLARAPSGFAFILDITVDEQVAADTLDVYIQTKLDGTNWVDVVHFTQWLGNGAAAPQRYIAKVTAGGACPHFDPTTALPATSVRNLMGDDWRVNYVIVDTSGNASFTFSVTAIPM